MIRRYDSIAALRADYLALGLTGSRTISDLSWYNNETENDTLRLTQSGNVSLVADAERLLSSLETTIETPRRIWQPSPAGAFCSVPDVLAGRPTCMRRQSFAPDETAPITILAVTTSSGGIDASTLSRRGTVILALVMALARIRPVSLHQLAILHGREDGETLITAEINTHPLDLATACYILTSAGFARRLTYGIAREINHFNGSWPAGFTYGSPQQYYDKIIPKLVADPSRTLLIGAAQLGDRLLSNPVEWINDQIRRFTSVDASRPHEA